MKIKSMWKQNQYMYYYILYAENSMKMKPYLSLVRYIIDSFIKKITYVLTHQRIQRNRPVI